MIESVEPVSQHAGGRVIFIAAVVTLKLNLVINHDTEERGAQSCSWRAMLVGKIDLNK